MGNKEILCTYRYYGNYTFDWLNENEDIYEDIEVVRIKVTDTLYQS